MPALSRRLYLTAATACFALVAVGAPAQAKTTHHKHHVTHHATHHAAKGSEIVRIAQRHLFNLGYYAGSADGIMGPQTRAAIKRFQRDHGLKADGVLGSKTNSALTTSDRNGSHQGRGQGGGQFSVHETVTGSDIGSRTVNPDFVANLNSGTSVVSSRFARVDINEAGGGASKRYNVNLNGQPILVADGQPSVIGVSPTYDLGDEDAVIFTTYSPNESGCIYRSHVLAMSGAATKLIDIDSCTRDYDAFAKNGSLFITFKDTDSNAAVGSAWRVEGMNANRL